MHSLLFVAFWRFVRQVFFDLCLVMGESCACVAKLVLCLFLSRLFLEFPTVCCVHQGVEPLKKVPFGARGKTFHQGSGCLYESVLFPFLVTPLLVKVLLSFVLNLLYPCLDLWCWQKAVLCQNFGGPEEVPPKASHPFGCSVAAPRSTTKKISTRM